jgi:uncharacterized protein DUF6544
VQAQSPEPREPAAGPCFHSSLLDGLDEPVRRYFAHAIPEGAPLVEGVRVALRGQIRLGTWLPFTSEQDSFPTAFTWRARVTAGPLTLFRATDRLADGAGGVDARLLGRLRVIHGDDAHTARSAAARAALEAAVFAPAALLGHPGIEWEAREDDLIRARWAVAPERPEIELRLGPSGAIRSVWAPRWGRQGTDVHQYIPFGGELAGERRFGTYRLPESLSVGWWWGTERFAPFFRAEVLAVAPVAAPRRGDT